MPFEADASARQEIYDALDQLQRAAAARAICLSGNRDAMRTAHMVVEPVETLFVDGQPRRIDELLCIVNESRDRDRPRSRSCFRLGSG